MGQRFIPVMRAANARDDQAGVVTGANDLVLIHVAVHLGTLKASLLHHFHLLGDRPFHAHGAPHDGFVNETLCSRLLDKDLVRGSSAWCQRSQCQHANTMFQKFTTLHISYLDSWPGNKAAARGFKQLLGPRSHHHTFKRSSSLQASPSVQCPASSSSPDCPGPISPASSSPVPR